MTHEEFVDEYNYMTGDSPEDLDTETLEALRAIIQDMMTANCGSVVEFDLNNKGKIKLLTTDTTCVKVE